MSEEVNFFLPLYQMKAGKDIKKPLNSKGAAIFKKMLDDKNALHEHFKKGGKIEDFKRSKSLT